MLPHSTPECLMRNRGTVMRRAAFEQHAWHVRTAWSPKQDLCTDVGRWNQICCKSGNGEHVRREAIVQHGESAGSAEDAASIRAAHIWPPAACPMPATITPTASSWINHGLTRAHTVRIFAASPQSSSARVWTGQALHEDCTKAACALLLGLEVSRKEGRDLLWLRVQAQNIGCVVHRDWMLVVAEGMETSLIGDHMVA